MDIHNIAIVRATDIVPLKGKIDPVKDVPFIKKEWDTAFASEMSSMLRRKGMLKPIDWEQPDEVRNAVEEKNKEIVQEYLPYTSMYNSMVLFSLNGLVPDDIRNTFSEKKCAVIDGLEEHMNKSEVRALHPTDSAIKGPVQMSENAVLKIKKEEYDRLSLEEKATLENAYAKVDVFEGDLKTAVDKTLIESGRYTAEKLTLASEGGGYEKSDTSEDVMQTINDVAKENNLSQLLHEKIFRGETDGNEKLEDVKGEFEQSGIVASFYKQAFFEYLFEKMDIDETTKTYAQMAPDAQVYMENLCDEISRVGIDKYKKIVDSYNISLEQLKESGKLPTPQQIVDAVKEDRKIDLVSKIEEINNKENILSNAIKATEEITTSTEIDKQKEALTQELNGLDKESVIE